VWQLVSTLLLVGFVGAYWRLVALVVEPPMLPNHDVFRADRVRGSRARATARASVRAEDGQRG
jgi:hypothetical protein